MPKRRQKRKLFFLLFILNLKIKITVKLGFEFCWLKGIRSKAIRLRKFSNHFEVTDCFYVRGQINFGGFHSENKKKWCISNSWVVLRFLAFLLDEQKIFQKIRFDAIQVKKVQTTFESVQIFVLSMKQK